MDDIDKELKELIISQGKADMLRSTLAHKEQTNAQLVKLNNQLLMKRSAAAPQDDGKTKTSSRKQSSRKQSIRQEHKSCVDIKGLSEVLKKVKGETDLDVFKSLMDELDDREKRTISCFVGLLNHAKGNSSAEFYEENAYQQLTRTGFWTVPDGNFNIVCIGWLEKINTLRSHKTQESWEQMLQKEATERDIQDAEREREREQMRSRMRSNQ